MAIWIWVKGVGLGRMVREMRLLAESGRVEPQQWQCRLFRSDFLLTARGSSTFMLTFTNGLHMYKLTL
jgi:hypothetical protein